MRNIGDPKQNVLFGYNHVKIIESCHRHFTLRSNCKAMADIFLVLFRFQILSNASLYSHIIYAVGLRYFAHMVRYYWLKFPFVIILDPILYFGTPMLYDENALIKYIDTLHSQFTITCCNGTFAKKWNSEPQLWFVRAYHCERNSIPSITNSDNMAYWLTICNGL